MAAPEGADDRALARALIAGVAAADVQRLAQTESSPLDASEPRESQLPSPVVGSDRSFLGRLQSEGSRAGQQSLAEVAHVPTLLAVLRAGSLWQRRAAAKRIAERLSEDELDAEDRHQIQEVLEHLRDVEIASELRTCQGLLSGPRARVALVFARAFSIMKSWKTPS